MPRAVLIALDAARLAGGVSRDADKLDSTWPPVLVLAAVVLAISAGVAVMVMMRRARAAARETRTWR